jgi:hypothetical protein
MRVEGNLAESRRHHAVEGKGQERLMEDRDERLGKKVGERGETGAESCGQDEGGGGTHRHLAAEWVFSTRRRMESAAKAAPNPLSMFTTVTPLAQLLTMPSRAVSPWKWAP